MNLLCILTAVLLLSALSGSSCEEGCIECEGSVCRACDKAALFFLQNDACAKFAGLHCVEINSDGHCVTCDQGFYLTSVGVCVYVYDRFPNCAEYSERENRIVCLRCLEGYHFLRNMCVNNIQKCAQYRVGRNQCQRCYPGYNPSEDLFSCIEAADSA